MKKLTVLLVMLSLFFCSAAFAGTPKDTLVIAGKIGDVITLDPAEIFEFAGAEYAGNTYDRLMVFDVNDISKITGGVVEEPTISDDGLTYTFKMRKGITFASGNPLTADDVVFSLRRVVKLNKGPAFILTQFGFTPENMNETIKKVGADSVQLTIDKAVAPSFFLSCLTSTPASIVDKKVVLAHEKDGDMGYNWLKTNYAGSGPYVLKKWKPSEVLILQANPDYWDGPAKLKRVITREVSESSNQRMLLEKGDVDIARSLLPEDIKAVAKDPQIKIQERTRATVWYLGLNMKNNHLKNPLVRKALRWLIDYAGIEQTILDGQAKVHQAFLPKGFLGALDENPYSLNVEKAKALLKEAGLEKGFTLTMDVVNTEPSTSMATAIQSTFAKAGIKLELIPGDNKQVLTRYRARKHDIFIGRWGADYMDPHTNADTFSRNPDNSDDARSKPLAWRNSWNIPELTKETDAAVMERDPQKRAVMYQDLQRKVQEDSPFILMFQFIEVVAERENVKGFQLGPNFDTNFYRFTTK